MSNFTVPLQHEKTSEEMFDYLLDANQLRQAFQKFGLNEQDIEFVKELVVGRPKDGWEHAARPKSKRWLYDVKSFSDNNFMIMVED